MGNRRRGVGFHHGRGVHRMRFHGRGGVGALGRSIGGRGIMPWGWGRGARGGRFALSHWWLTVETTIALIDFRSGRGPKRWDLAARPYGRVSGRTLVAVALVAVVV